MESIRSVNEMQSSLSSNMVQDENDPCDLDNELMQQQNTYPDKQLLSPRKDITCVGIKVENDGLIEEYIIHYEGKDNTSTADLHSLHIDNTVDRIKVENDNGITKSVIYDEGKVNDERVPSTNEDVDVDCIKAEIIDVTYHGVNEETTNHNVNHEDPFFGSARGRVRTRGHRVESTGRGRGRSRGRRRGRGRAQTRSVAQDELTLDHIDRLPTAHQLETPLHTRRKRAWRPNAGPSTSGPLPDVAATEGSSIQSSEDDVQKFELESSFEMPPSPELFVPSTSQDASPPRTVLHWGVPDDETNTFLCNFGSESEESDEEDVMAFVIPRTYQSLMETPDTDGHEININFTDAGDIADISDTYKPHTFFDFDWTAFPQAPFPPELRRETFSNINCGPTSPCVDPLDTFIAIWDRQFMEYIAAETNRYAQELANYMMSNDSLHPRSRICDWQDTTPDEVYVYFAIVLAMGVVVKTKVEEYWGSTPDVFYTPGFSAHMSLRRFQLLSKCIHFNNNGAMAALELDDSAAKLYKIQPVISHLNCKFQSMYNLNQNIALDESLLQWKGWLDVNQFIPNKAAAVGIKNYEICESKTGYLWRFEAHAHKKTQTTQTDKSPLEDFTPAIVLNLINGLENRGHTLWMDSFYNSPALARKLKSIGLDCVGTLRTNRLFVPDALRNLSKANMQPGQIAGFTSGDIDLMVWRDSSRIAMISTYHGNAVNTLHGSTKPILISDYNTMMGGVDKKDQNAVCVSD